MSALSSLLASAPSLAMPYAARAPQAYAAPARAGGDANASTDILGKHVERLGGRTLDLAQDFLGSFAQNVLGADAKGMQVSFDDFDLSASSTFASASLAAQGPGGAVAAAGASLDDAADFSGSGTITTADGRSFHFSIEVHYAMHAEASAASATSASQQDGGSANDLHLPFNGGLADLLRLFRNDSLAGTFSQPDAKGGEAHKGNFIMRLLDEITPPADAQGTPARAYQDAAPAPGALLATQA